jgi:hypothetical protein
MNLQVDFFNNLLVLAFYNLEELMPTKWSEEANIPKKREFIPNIIESDRNQDGSAGFTSGPVKLMGNVSR